MTSSRPPKVLLIAEAANPDLTSVALIGYSLSRALGEVCDAHFVTELRNGPSIEKAGVPPEDYTCIDNRTAQNAAFQVAKVLRGGSGVGWTIYSALGALAYPLFERKIWKEFGARIQAGEFDLVHRITPLSPTSVSWLSKPLAKAKVPFLIGPLNGGIPWPKGFDSVRRKEREWLSYVRGAYKLSPGLKDMRANAAALLLASRHTYGEVVGDSSALERTAIYLPENAIDPARFPEQAPPTAPLPGEPLRAAFVGRLVPYKGADMLLRASQNLLKKGVLRLDIIGDGPEMGRLKELARELGIEACVDFPGWVEHRDLNARLRQSHVFAFPSVREFGGGVVLEAMALGLVPVVVDYGGPAELVPDGCGLVVPMGSREEIVQSFEAALSRLTRERADIPEMGRKAQDFVRRRFTWRAKAEQILEVYKWVLGQRPDKPSFGMPFTFGDK
jgi:glycosyltransferase involved in cell wall biosynthesis